MEYTEIHDRRRCRDADDWLRHGRRICLVLDRESAGEFSDIFLCSSEGMALSIFEDGCIMLTNNVYDIRMERCEEFVINIYEGKAKEDMIRRIDAMLSLEPFGPGGKPAVDSYDKAVRFINKI